MDPSASGTSKPLIGVIGKGFVGNAVYEGFRHAFDVVAWDHGLGFFVTEPAGQTNSWPTEDAAYRKLVTCEVIFVCVPTPMREDGSCDTSIVESVVRRISQSLPAPVYDLLHRDSGAPSAVLSGKPPLVVIKSTIPPGTTSALQGKYRRLDICFNPEFLRENSAVEDFKNQRHVLVGGGATPAYRLAQLYFGAFPGIMATRMPPTDAELVKYTVNTFLAVKCSFANEMYEICDRFGVPYETMITAAMKQDDRLGTSHWQVPGPDGKAGWSGKCFPKDLNALAACARQLGVKPTMLEAAWQKNLEVRPERDWEQIGGVLSEVKG